MGNDEVNLQIAIKGSIKKPIINYPSPGLQFICICMAKTSIALLSVFNNLWCALSSLKIVKGQINQKVMLDKTSAKFFPTNFSLSPFFPPDTSHTKLQERHTFSEESRWFFQVAANFGSDDKLHRSHLKPWASLGGKDFRECLWFWLCCY